MVRPIDLTLNSSSHFLLIRYALFCLLAIPETGQSPVCPRVSFSFAISSAETKFYPNLHLPFSSQLKCYHLTKLFPV